MIQSAYISTAVGSLLILLVLFNDYIRKFSMDNFQRSLFIAVTAFAGTAVFFDFIGNILAGINGRWVTITMYASVSLYFIAQNCTYWLTILLIDYIANKNIERVKVLLKITGVFIVIYAISVIINLHYGFYFTISDDNLYMRGKLHLLRMALCYALIPVILIDLFSALHQFRSFQVYAIILFIIISATGAVLDLIIEGSSLKWPCFTASLAYIYFSIIQFDAKLDSLTGLGNRYSFNEFITKLSKQNTTEKYSVAILDMDRFKEINDTFGHLEGDNALKDMAAIISASIRHSDLAARYGGDEFVIAIKKEKGIPQIMKRIQTAMDIQNEKGIRPYKLYMSYGYDVFTTNSGQSIKKFINQIDSLMYKQKEEHHRLWVEREEKNV